MKGRRGPTDEELAEAWRSDMTIREVARSLGISTDYLKKRWRWIRTAGMIGHVRPVDDDARYDEDDRSDISVGKRDLLLERLRKHHG